MESGYKVWGQDIGNLLEFFTVDEQNAHTVVDSRFTNGSGMYKKGGVDLKTALGGTFPTSAGADYPGGYNLLPSYKTNGVSMDVALKGCRPIGVPLKDVGAGSYVIYRSGDKTYFASGTQPTGGEELPHSPQYVFFELQGAGGGGGGSVNLYSGSGGGSGAYFFGVIKIDEPIYIVVGEGGAGGKGKTSGKGNDGLEGTASSITTNFNSTAYILTAQSGRGGDGGNNGNNGGPGGQYFFTPETLDDLTSCKIVTMFNGASGGARRTSPDETNAMGEVTNNWLKPEGGSFTRPGGTGGYSNDTAGYGGGGAASVFGDGGGGGYQHDGYASEAYGAGGGAAGNYVGRPSDGAKGSDGRFILYY